MKFFAKYIKPIIIFISLILIIPAILTILNLLKLNTNKIEIIIIGSILMLILGFLIGRKTKNKGYLNGLIFSIICISVLLILSLIFKYKINITTLIYYFILMFSSIFGSMFGISLKKKN